MKINIDNIVKQTLNERYELNNRFKVILENEESTDDEKFDDVVNASADLEGMGKSDDEIEGSLDEGITDFLSKYISPGGDETSDSQGNSLSKGDLKGKVSSGLMSQIREYIIRKLLGMVDLQEIYVTRSRITADLNLGDVLVVFKGEDSCKKHGDKLADAFMEGLFVYVCGGEKNSAQELTS